MTSKNPPTPTADYSKWLSKKQAAEAIGCCTKLVEELSAAGKIQHYPGYRRPTGGPRISVYHPGDVETQRQERNPTAPPFVMPATMKLSPPINPTKITLSKTLVPAKQTALAFSLPDWQTLQRWQKQLERNTVRIPERLYLSLAEASEYSGWPQSWLKNALNKGTLMGRFMNGVGWRIKRSDLEKL